MSEPRNVGLARALSKLGFCSRSRAAKLIREGRVRLNGVPRRDPETPVRLERDRLDVDGDPLTSAPRMYLMLNKPRGLVTTASDERGRDTVYSLLGSELPWISAVGRLDKASEGLLLFTNDSEWAARLLDPASHMDKTYHVHVRGQVDDRVNDRLVKGVHAQDGWLSAKRAEVLRAGDKNTWLEIVLDEGQYRQIRRMLEGLGFEVLRLVRIALGPLRLGSLAKGKYRQLEAREKRALDQAIGIARTLKRNNPPTPASD